MIPFSFAFCFLQLNVVAKVNESRAVAKISSISNFSMFMYFLKCKIGGLFYFPKYICGTRSTTTFHLFKSFWCFYVICSKSGCLLS